MWSSSTNKLYRAEAEPQLWEELENLLKGCQMDEIPMYQKELVGFFRLFCKYWRNSEPQITWEKIRHVPSDLLIEYSHLLEPPAEVIKEQLSKLVVVKLNGGLGTTMNCKGPKSLITARQGLSFLDITVNQIVNLNVKYSTNVSLVLMNSFSTDEITKRVLRKYKGLRIKIYTFMQHKYPRIHCDSFAPLPESYEDPAFHAWYPPGHGDFYESFCASGLCEDFLRSGKKYCFVSNIDNLGAVINLPILNHLANPGVEPKPEFMMEVTGKTAGDVKGGTLIHYEGKLRLLEIAQVSGEHVEDFTSVRQFKIFNTNNLWMKLEAVDRLVGEDALNMPVIENRKRIRGSEVIQLETAAGSAIDAFEGSVGIVVPRARFLPVKTTADLFLIRSNVYTFEDGVIRMNPKRSSSDAPLLRLGRRHFGLVGDIDKRFHHMPDVRELSSFSVTGDVHFDRDVTLSGHVVILANQGERLDIPAGAVLENKILTGSLRILDH